MDVLPKDSLADWIVTTRSGSRYFVSMDDSTVRRLPGLAGKQSVTLRRDGDVLPLMEPPTIRVGKVGVFIVAGLRKGSYTIRATTPVVATEQAPEVAHSGWWG